MSGGKSPLLATILYLTLLLNTSMLFIKKPACILFFIAGLIACNNTGNSPGKKEPTAGETKSLEQGSELKVGGLYLTRDDDSSYSACKIVALDEIAVHVRFYKEKFATQPTTLSSSTLTVMIGHSPIDKQGFLQGQPILLAVEDVKESELEGYKIYLEAMK